ncbi:MAG: carbonic anhydrase family protein [Chlorobi bacterium]|nr:carbonic anhydrase family protein [Chlorobiota bacterium]
MKKNIAIFSLLIFILSAGISCQENSRTKQQKDPMHQENTHSKPKDCSGVHWSHHKGHDGPENWKNLCDGFADCGGQRQSPVDIDTKKVTESADLKAPGFHYGKTRTRIINNGHTVQFDVDEGSTVKLNGKDYRLLQFHYHAPSEHTVNGRHYPLEVHFVHQHAGDDLAVIGIFFKEGKKNPLFEKYLNKFPEKEGKYDSADLIDLMSLMPDDKSYYYYDGSLTTPPCTEIVSWYVMKQPLEASKDQIEKFSKILNRNFRPVQPLNGRRIRLYNDKKG